MAAAALLQRRCNLDLAVGEHIVATASIMHTTTSSSHSQRRLGLRLLALLAIPMMLLLHAPVLAALVPGALWTIASLTNDEVPRALPTTELVRVDEPVELHRIAVATPVSGSSRRIG